jgi:erythronate-4-phosphate dehydrogenase
VGTATIGFDHIDVDYLKNNQIEFACAPGSNANSVVEYIISCLSILAEQNQFNIYEKVFGIVGVGNVGSLLRQRLTQLGIQCICNDPPRAALGEKEFVELEAVIKQADIISLHTPLVIKGDYPTHHLFNHQRLQQLKPGAILINTSRGSVIDNVALLDLLKQRSDIRAVLDVWENEPHINLDLLDKISLATPHIAGYSLDGKMRGTDMVYKQACRYFTIPISKQLEQFLPQSGLTKLSFSPNANPQMALDIAIRACYDVRRDDHALRYAACQQNYFTNNLFDQLRKNYPVRREFDNVKIHLKHGKTDMINKFKALGFSIKED